MPTITEQELSTLHKIKNLAIKLSRENMVLKVHDGYARNILELAGYCTKGCSLPIRECMCIKK